LRPARAWRAQVSTRNPCTVRDERWHAVRGVLRETAFARM
jgi:hypothetical protein